jgi:hypothetical protein
MAQHGARTLRQEDSSAMSGGGPTVLVDQPTEDVNPLDRPLDTRRLDQGQAADRGRRLQIQAAVRPGVRATTMFRLPGATPPQARPRT